MEKYIVISFFLLIISGSVWAGAANPDPGKSSFAPVATYDSVAVAASMYDLEVLDQYIIQERTTLEEVKASRPDLLEGLNLRGNASPLQPLAGPEDPLGVPSFLLGCTLGIAGVVLAYIFSEKNEVEAKKALNGCIFQTVFILAVYIGVYAYLISQFGL